MNLNPTLSQTDASPRTSPAPRYTMEDPPSWLGARQTSDNSGQLELDVALGLKASPHYHPRDTKNGTKSVPLSPMNNADDVEKLSHIFQHEPSSARSIEGISFEASLKSDQMFYSPALGDVDNRTDNSKIEGGPTSFTSSKRRQRRSEVCLCVCYLDSS